jgi:hypothetical protein
MKTLIFIIIHLIAAAVILVFIRRGVIKASVMVWPVLIFMPAVGEAAVLIIHLHAICTGYAGILTVKAHHDTGKPICLTEHGIYSREREEELIRSNWTSAVFKEQWISFYYMLSSAIYKKAVRITSLFHDASKIQQSLGCDPKRCEVISNGINYERFSSVGPKEPDGYVDIGL